MQVLKVRAALDSEYYFNDQDRRALNSEKA